MVDWLAIVPLLTFIDHVAGAVKCSEESFYINECKKSAYKEFAILFGIDKNFQLIPAIAAGVASVVSNVIVLVIFIICANRPLQRAPTEEELEELQEDEDEIEAKNKNFMNKLKRKQPKGKGKKPKGTMQDFVISNEAVCKEDVQTVPMQPVVEPNGQSATATSNVV